MHPNDPNNDQSHLERIVAEFIAGDELLDVIGSLGADDYASWEVALLRVLRDYPHLFGRAWPMLEEKLYERADAEDKKRVSEGAAMRVELAA